MSLLVGNNILGKEIADALGLKHCRRIDFHLSIDSIATVTAEFYPEVDGIKQFPAILKKFKLVPLEEETTCLGDKVASYTYLEKPKRDWEDHR